MACLNEHCEYAQHCHLNVNADVKKEQCAMYWKLEDYAWDAVCLRDPKEEDFEDMEEDDE